MNLQESIRRILREDRFKGYKRFLKDNIFTDFPEYVINDMFRESGDLDYSEVQGMTKDQIIDYFFNGEGKRYFDRWGGYEGKNAKVVKIEWNDLTEPLKKFLKTKMSGENPYFLDSKEKLIKIMEREPNLGKGDNEPILLKYNKEGKIEDISGGNHRTYAAFKLNDFKPILMKAYVDNYQKPLQESIRKILKEETEGIDSFLDEISSKHNMSDELKDFVKQFIEESDCKRINFSRFKMGVMGLALESGVLINSVALNHPLPFLLFLIFHEVAHQYQFKKYGEDVMYDCYLGEISEREAAEFMKHTEEVADDFAFRKIRQLQKLNLIGPYTPPQMYKNVPIQQITMMISNYRNDMRRKNIDSPKKVSEYFYNIVKSEL